MKKHLLFFCFICLAILPLQAQEENYATRGVSVSLAPLASFLTNRPELLHEQRIRIGFQEQLDLEFHVWEKWWFRAGLSYSQWRYRSIIDTTKLIFTSPETFTNLNFDSEDRLIAVPAAMRYMITPAWYLEAEATGYLVLNSDDYVIRPGFGIYAGWQKTFGQSAIFVRPGVRMIIPVSPITPIPREYWQYPWGFALEIGCRRHW